MTPTKAYDNGAPGSRLPVLGWSSWVALGPGSDHPIFDYCDEFSVKSASDAFVALGFKDAGYTAFHLDDCWADKNRNESGFLQGELDHFPNGMKTVVDHVHSSTASFSLRFFFLRFILMFQSLLFPNFPFNHKTHLLSITKLIRWHGFWFVYLCRNAYVCWW